MYQILERRHDSHHAVSDFYQTEYFFLNEENAIEFVQQISKKSLGQTFKEVVAWDEEDNEIFDLVHYDIKDCYKIEKIIPFEEKYKLSYS